MTLLGALVAGALAAGPWSGPARAQLGIPVQMDVQPAFDGMASRGGVFPVVVTLRNLGPGAEGVLSAEPSAFMGARHRYLYPLQLPSGTVKRVVVYPSLARNDTQLRIAFAGNFRGRRIERDVPFETWDGRQVALISDQAGGLGALRHMPDRRQNAMPAGSPSLRTCDARPEDAPDRMVGYTALDTLVVANGAERMAPAQWAAIRRWVLAGGSLILCGGPGAVYLQVPDAQPLLPVQPPRGVETAALRLPWSDRALPGPVGLMTGALKPGAEALAREGGRILAAQQALGAGRVLFLAFSPVEKPFRGWADERLVWRRLMADAQGVSGAVWRLAMRTDADGYRTGYPPMAMNAQPGTDPFQVQLPPTRTIVIMLVAYFILVVPVSYVVLRRVGHLEWAWVTGPLLSIGFALGFGLFAAQLYKAGLSRRTGGMLVAAAGQPDALFVGSTELFFPRGGEYPLDIPGAEILEMRPENEYESPTMKRDDPLDTVDNGSVIAPRFAVTNLAFRRVYHAEPVVWSGLTGEVRVMGDGTVSGTIRNGTASDLTDASLILLGTGRCVGVGAIKAGQARSLSGLWISPPISGSGPSYRLGMVPPGIGGSPVPAGPPMPAGPPPTPATVPVPGPARVRPGQPLPQPMPQPMPHPMVRSQDIRWAERVAGQSPIADLLIRSRTGLDRPDGVVLYGRAPGTPFGPSLGHDVGRGPSVDVFVSLPLVQGGA